MMDWSSASTMRMRLSMVLFPLQEWDGCHCSCLAGRCSPERSIILSPRCDGKHDLELQSMRLVLGKRTGSSQGLAPFHDSFDTKSGGKLRICRVAAIVRHGQEHVLVSFLHLDSDSGGTCMTHDIGEGFL